MLKDKTIEKRTVSGPHEPGLLLASDELSAYAQTGDLYVGLESRPLSLLATGDGKRCRPAGSRPWWQYVLVVLAVYGCAYAGAVVSHLGMDWGYYVVEALVGQTHDDQWMGAIYLAWLVAPSIYMAMALSMVKRVLPGGRRWYLLLLGQPLMWLCILSGSDRLAVFFWQLALNLLALCLSRGFDWLLSEISYRARVFRLFASMLVAIVPAAAIYLLSEFPSGVWERLALYCGLLFASGFFGSVSARARKHEAALAAVFMMSLPLTIFNLANVVFATFCAGAGSLVHMDICWQALFSALLISATSLLSLALGALSGSSGVRMQQSFARRQVGQFSCR